MGNLRGYRWLWSPRGIRDGEWHFLNPDDGFLVWDMGVVFVVVYISLWFLTLAFRIRWRRDWLLNELFVDSPRDKGSVAHFALCLDVWWRFLSNECGDFLLKLNRCSKTILVLVNGFLAGWEQNKLWIPRGLTLIEPGGGILGLIIVASCREFMMSLAFFLAEIRNSSNG